MVDHCGTNLIADSEMMNSSAVLKYSTQAPELPTGVYSRLATSSTDFSRCEQGMNRTWQMPSSNSEIWAWCHKHLPNPTLSQKIVTWCEVTASCSSSSSSSEMRRMKVLL